MRKPWDFPSGSGVKNSRVMQETWAPFLGREDPLKEGMATQSSTLAWRTPWTGATVHRVVKSQALLKRQSTHARKPYQPIFWGWISNLNMTIYLQTFICINNQQIFIKYKTYRLFTRERIYITIDCGIGH